MSGRLLFVNACVCRETSRTLRLARRVLECFPDMVREELVLEEMHLSPLSSDDIRKRTELCARCTFDDPIFDLAKKFSEADIIVVATPYWEDSFNSYTKIFMEYAAAVGIAFRYSETGMPVGMCKARALYYVTTRGGPIRDEDDLGFRTYETLCGTYGIGRCIPISASGLDIVNNDAEGIMRKALESVPSAVIIR